MNPLLQKFIRLLILFALVVPLVLEDACWMLNIIICQMKEPQDEAPFYLTLNNIQTEKNHT